jgi:hypothetical protein
MSVKLPCQARCLRNTTRLTLCTAMLQIIMSGTASVGGSTCSSIAPATAENANPAIPDTKAPAKTPALRIRNGATSIIVGLAGAQLRERSVLP